MSLAQQGSYCCTVRNQWMQWAGSTCKQQLPAACMKSSYYHAPQRTCPPPSALCLCVSDDAQMLSTMLTKKHPTSPANARFAMWHVNTVVREVQHSKQHCKEDTFLAWTPSMLLCRA
jgi:hypothetical protein